MRGITCSIASILTSAVGAEAFAQNTSALASPEVVPGERSLEYRLALGLNGSETFGHRFQYQQSLDDSLRLRLVLNGVDRAGADFDIQNVQVHAFWQFLESERAGWDGALVGQVAAPLTDGRPWRYRVGWSSSVALSPRWQANGVIFAGRESGDGARDGILLETRAEALYKLDGSLRIRAQAFSDFNTTAAFGDFDEQRHQLGFIAKGKLATRLSCSAGVLFGLSDGAPDADLRFFLARSF